MTVAKGEVNGASMLLVMFRAASEIGGFLSRKEGSVLVILNSLATLQAEGWGQLEWEGPISTRLCFLRIIISVVSL
jgi:hypothetical protein